MRCVILWLTFLRVALCRPCAGCRGGAAYQQSRAPARLRPRPCPTGQWNVQQARWNSSSGCDADSLPSVLYQPVFAANTLQRQISYYSEEELLAERKLQEQSGTQPGTASSSTPSSSSIRTPVPASTPSRSPPLQSRRSSSATTPARRSSIPPTHSLHPSAEGPHFDFAAAHASHKADLVDSSEHGVPLPGSSASAPSPFEWSSSALQASLPLLPGQHVDVPIQLQAKEDWSTFPHTPLARSFRVLLCTSPN